VATFHVRQQTGPGVLLRRRLSGGTPRLGRDLRETAEGRSGGRTDTRTPLKEKCMSLHARAVNGLPPSFPPRAEARSTGGSV